MSCLSARTGGFSPTLLVLSVFILSFFLAGCATRPAPELTVQGPRKETPFNFAKFNLGTDAGPEGTILFNQALDALAVQDWNRAVDSLLAGARSAPADHRGIFVSLLKLMWDQPFPAQKVCAALTELNPAGTADYALLSGLADSSPMQIIWPDQPVVLPWLGPPDGGFAEFLGFSTRNLPTVEVRVNGTKLRMVLDTGAAATSLYTDAARKAGLRTENPVKLDITSNNSLTGKSSLTLAASLILGSLEVRNARIWCSERPLGYDNFDGLIGWPVLSQLAMKLDSRAKRITLSPSASQGNPSPRYLWLGEPLVLVDDLQQTWAHFFMMDTGATQTCFGESALKDFKADYRAGPPALHGGVFGLDRVPSTLVDSLDMVIDGFIFRFRNYQNAQAGHHFFTFVKGMLGCDLARQGILTLDFPAGKLTFEPWPSP